MKFLPPVFHALVVFSGAVLLAGCHGARPASVGVKQGRLAPCPSSPNCVSSSADDELHRIAPLPFSGAAAAAIGRIEGIVRFLPRASVITATETYLHAGFRSAVFRFVDDVEFLADEPAGVIQVRSASQPVQQDPKRGVYRNLRRPENEGNKKESYPYPEGANPSWVWQRSGELPVMLFNTDLSQEVYVV